MNAYMVLVGKPERKRSVEIPIYMWVYNIKIYLREKVWRGVV
jgi:hypothetical protein